MMDKKNKVISDYSRSTSTLFNFTSSLGGQFITILMHFIVRTVFIHTLGKPYLGITGLFNNILQMLSLAEFGVGSAILYKLYDPVARKDEHRIAVLLSFYKHVYRFIGLGVAAIGIMLIPFLPVVIKDYDKLERLHMNAVFIFLLYLSKTVVSYLFFAYKSSIIRANQKEYLLNVISYFFILGATILQIISLITLRSFTVYVVIMIIQVIGNNIVWAILADRMYPYINQKGVEKLPKAEVLEICKDCAAIFLFKLNEVVLKATDNLVLGAFIGLDAVAVYSNYYVLYTTLNTLLNQIFNSVSHSFGNLRASESEEKHYRVFKAAMFITAILGGTAGVGIFVASDELVEAWIGHEWVITQPFALLMGLEVFTLAFDLMLSKFRTTMGLFQEAKFRPVAGMIINLAASVALVNVWGIVGVLVGTVLSNWTTVMWYDPIIIYRYGYKNRFPVYDYFIKLLIYVMITCAVGGLDFLICKNLFTGHGWFSVIVHSLIVAVTVPPVFILVMSRTQEGAYVIRLFSGYLKKVFKKTKK